MLPTLPKRVRAAKAQEMDSRRRSPTSSSAAQSPSGDPTPPALDLLSPVSSPGGTVMSSGRPPRSRGQPLPLGSPSAGDVGQSHPVTHRGATPPAVVQPEKGHPHRSLLPAVIDTSGAGGAPGGGAVATPPGAPHGQQLLPQPQRPASEVAYHRSSLATPAQQIPLGSGPGPVFPADTQAIQLLQYMHQLLQGGVSTAVVQQWVSGQLSQASAYAAAAAAAASSPTAATLPASGAVRPGSGRPSSLSPTQQHFLQSMAPVPQVQPPSPLLAGSSRLQRRPVVAVSFTVQGSNWPEAQLLLPHQHGIPEMDGEAAYANLTPADSFATAAAAARGEGLTVAMPVQTDVADISNSDDTPPERETGTPGSAGRGVPVSGADDPLVVLAEVDGSDGLTAHPPRGGGLRSKRPVLQHPQWRSFRNGNGNTSSARAQPNNSPPSGTWGTSGSSANSGPAFSASNPSGVTASNASQSENSARRRSATSMHHATKAALHATTSQFVVEEQKNITVFLGERFSRYPEMIFKRRIDGQQTSTSTGAGAGNNSAGVGIGAGSPLSPAAGRLSWENPSHRAHHDDVGSSLEEEELDCGEISDTGDAGRLEVSGGTAAAAAAQTRSPSTVKPPSHTSNRGLLAVAAAAVAGDSPLVDATASTTASSLVPPRARIGSRPPSATTPPSLLAAAMELSDDAGTVPIRHSISNDRSAMSIGSDDGDDAQPARPRGQRTTHDFSNIAVTVQSRGDGSLKQQARYGCNDSTSSNLSSAAAAAAPIDGAAANGLNNAAAANPHDAKGERAAEVDVQHVGSLIEVDMDASSIRSREAQRFSGERHSSAPGRHGSVITVNPFAWGQLPGTGSNTSTGVLASSLSQIAWSSAAVLPNRNRATSLTPRRTTSLISTASSQLGCGASGGQGNASFTNYGNRESASLREDIPSFASSHTAGVSLLGDGTNGNRRRRSSVLHLSRSSINGGVDPTMEGIMASFILDDIAGLHGRQGPRFMRSFCRHTPVRATESVTHAALEALGVPFLENIDQANTPVNVLGLMNVYGFTSAASFYVAACLNVFLRYAFVQRFGWNVQKLKLFLETAATFFRAGNPAHHAVHAVDVVLAGHQWLSEGSTGAALSDEEVMAFLFSAAVLQLAHTGADNGFLAQLKHPYAMLCSYSSPQHGVAVALVMALLNRPELHFFPAPVGPPPPCAAASVTSMASLLAHEWTASRESQLYHTLAELIMAADERNHLMLKQNIVRIGEENARRHGCLCACVRTDRSSSFSGPSRTMNRSISPAESTYVRPQNPSSQGNFCLNCCAYITDTNVPDVLKAVMQFMDFAYLYRPYDVYVTGLVSYIAEVYRQSEVEYRVLERQRIRQEQSEQHLHRDSETVPPSLLAQPPQPPAWYGSPASPLLDASEVVKDPFEDIAKMNLCPPAVSFATALLAEDQPWRQGVARTSTVTMLRRNGEEAAPVPPPPGTAAAAAAAVMGTPPPSRRVTAVTPTNATRATEASTSPFLRALVGPSSPTTAKGTETSAPKTANTTSTPTAAAAATAASARPPLPAAPTGAAHRVQPLRGLGRDIVLISIEELSLPFMEQLAPYIPEAWVSTALANHDTLTRSLPTPEEWDNVLNQLLDLGEMTEEETAAAAAYCAEQELKKGADVDSMDTITPGHELPFTLPFHLLGPLRPMASEWNVNKDGLVRRVLQEILRGPELLLADVDME